LKNCELNKDGHEKNRLIADKDRRDDRGFFMFLFREYFFSWLTDYFFVFQDEKNQLLITNIWLKLVRADTPI